jgi:predicted component of type VI protein secretion system
VLTPVSGLDITYANSSYVIAPGQTVQLRVSVREGSQLGVVARIGDFSYQIIMRYCCFS